MNSLKKYIILWISQSVSQLGSSMTAFALVLWAYAQSHSALSVSVMSFCEYVPYIVVSKGALRELGLQFDDITHILITHGHGDHVGAILNERGENNFPNATLMIACLIL